MNHDGLMYRCEACGSVFTQETNLAVHRQSQHEGLSLPCNVCGNLFGSKTNLNKHIKMVHDKFRYNCNQCDYNSTRKQILAMHEINVHADGSVAYLREHVKTQSGEKSSVTMHLIMQAL